MYIIFTYICMCVWVPMSVYINAYDVWSEMFDEWWYRPGVGNYSSWTKSNPLPDFVNKVLMDHSHVPLFTYCL